MSVQIRHQFGTRLLERKFASIGNCLSVQVSVAAGSGNTDPVKSLIVLSSGLNISCKYGFLQRLSCETEAPKQLIPRIFPCLQGFPGEELARDCVLRQMF